MRASLLLVIIVFTFGCNNTKTKEKHIVKVEFINNIEKYVNQKIEITAIVNHVCQHGGKRMFLSDGNSDEVLKVVTGKNMAAFNTDLEGYSIKVIGIVDELRIDEKYLLEWEQEILREIESVKNSEEYNNDGHVVGSKGDEADQGNHQSDIESIENFRKQIAESNSDHLSFYSVICEKYEIIK